MPRRNGATHKTSTSLSRFFRGCMSAKKRKPPHWGKSMRRKGGDLIARLNFIYKTQTVALFFPTKIEKSIFFYQSSRLRENAFPASANAACANCELALWIFLAPGKPVLSTKKPASTCGKQALSTVIHNFIHNCLHFVYKYSRFKRKIRFFHNVTKTACAADTTCPPNTR